MRKIGKVWKDYASAYGPRIMNLHRSRWYRSNRHRPASTEEVEDFIKEVSNRAI